MDLDKGIVEAFRKNRVGVKIKEKYVDYSTIEYVLEKLTKEDIDKNKKAKIIRDMRASFSFVPAIYLRNFGERINVIVPNPSPSILGYSEKDKFSSDDDEKKGILSFAIGYDLLTEGVNYYGLFDYSPMLIYGDDGYGKTNFIKVILEEFKGRPNFRFIVADPLKKGEYDAKSSDPGFTVIKDKDEIMNAVCNIEKEIKKRIAIDEVADEEDREYTDEEKKSMGPLVFIIDDYSALLDDRKNAEAIKKMATYISDEGFDSNVYLFLSSSRVPPLFREDGEAIFKSVVAFHCDNSNFAVG